MSCAQDYMSERRFALAEQLLHEPVHRAARVGGKIILTVLSVSVGAFLAVLLSTVRSTGQRTAVSEDLGVNLAWQHVSNAASRLSPARHFLLRSQNDHAPQHPSLLQARPWQTSAPQQVKQSVVSLAAEGSCCPPGAAPYLAADHADRGEVGKIDADGLRYYHVGSGKVGLLILPDVWGFNGGRTRAIADDFADKGYSVWVPAILEPYESGTDGDGLPPSFDLSTRMSELGPLIQGPWNRNAVMPNIEKVVQKMKSTGIGEMGVIGFCYGAWVGFHLSSILGKDEILAGASAHPSLHIEGMVGGDPAEVAAQANCPWALFPAGDATSGGDPDIYDQGGAVFKALEAKFPGRNEVRPYEKMQHGFVSRGAIKEGFKCGDGDDVKKSAQECVESMAAFLAKNGLAPTPP